MFSRSMYSEFVRVAAVTPDIQVASCSRNAEQILDVIQLMDNEDVHMLCFPELCITGYTCGDLFLQERLLESAKTELDFLVKSSSNLGILVIVGLPLIYKEELYNVAAVFCNGKILGFIPKTYITDYSESYESRYFSSAPQDMGVISFYGAEVPFGTKQLFNCKSISKFTVAVEICEDLLASIPPSTYHAMAGATIIANLSASSEIIGRAESRRNLIKAHSARQICGYVLANAGMGESTTDLVFAGHGIIAENGVILDEDLPFNWTSTIAEIDLQAITHERIRTKKFTPIIKNEKIIKEYVTTNFFVTVGQIYLKREINPTPFILPKDKEMKARCDEVLKIQAHGLEKRIRHTKCERIIIGISGGLDSTLALLTAVQACFAADIAPHEAILGVTMPCFGTTERTKSNALKLCEALDIECREIDITETVKQHLYDIQHPEEQYDIVFENAQARMRTIVLMNLANQMNGIVLGTGNMSELALGWATYNGDHMSMYATNAGIPKTIVLQLVQHITDECKNCNTTEDYEAVCIKYGFSLKGGHLNGITEVLDDILNTTISPELLPPSQGIQSTEDTIGPYELHDFFLYHMLRWGRKPTSIFDLANYAFKGKYTPLEILKWLKLFYHRFFSQQFKRSCMPDSPKVGSVSLSPRGDWRMPSDASSYEWLSELEGLEVVPLEN